MRRGVLLLTLALALLAGATLAGIGTVGTSGPAAATCGLERWSVKTLQDPAGRALNLARYKTTTVSALRGKPIKRGPGGSRGGASSRPSTR